MGSAKITFWGVRGSIPSPGRKTMIFGGNTACVEISSKAARIICDAGTGIRELGLSLERRASRLPVRAHLILSHIHWDHFMGLPFFTPLYRRGNHFVIAGPRAGRMTFRRALSRAMHPPYFPVPFSAMPAGLSFKTVSARPFSIGDVRVEPMAMNHPGGALGWRFFFPDGRSLVHVTDNEPGSRRRRAALVQWMSGADAMIHDAQYDPRSYRHHRGWGHSPFTFPIDLAAEAGIGRLYLFHFDPQDDDAHLKRVLLKARRYARERSLSVEVDMAREGLSFSL